MDVYNRLVNTLHLQIASLEYILETRSGVCVATFLVFVSLLFPLEHSPRFVDSS